MSGASVRCSGCRTWYLVDHLVDGVCRDCRDVADGVAGDATRASVERRARLAAMSDAAQAGVPAWVPPEGFDPGRLEARDRDGEPLIIPRDERMAPPVEPRKVGKVGKPGKARR